MVERRLGRGLDFFLSRSNAPADAGGAAAPTGEEVVQAELSSLVASPYQPRKEFEEAELKELADSIRASGLLQPVLARRVGDKLEIIAGERRWRAAGMAGLERIPVLVRDVTDDRAAVFGLVENLQRADLNPIEKAQAFRRIQELIGGKQDDVARQVGLDRSSVANFVRLLDLPDEVQAHVSRGTLTMGHARALLGLRSASEQKELAEQAIRARLSVRQIEQIVKDLQGKAPPAPGGKKAPETGKAQGARPPWLIEIEETLVDQLRTPVQVRYGKRRSTITIECRGRDEFERLYELLKNAGDAED